MLALYWTPEAIADREAIYDWIEADNPIAALEMDELFELKAGNLLNHPHMGRQGQVAQTRELVVHRHYLLIYDVTGSAVRILRVLHTARQWPSR